MRLFLIGLLFAVLLLLVAIILAVNLGWISS